MAGTASALDSSTIKDSTDNIALQILDIKNESGNTIKIDYGSPLVVSLDYPADSDSIEWLDLKDADNNYERLMRRALDDDGTDVVNISSSTYGPVTNFTLQVYTSKAGVTLNTSNAATLSGNAWVIRADVTEPIISLSLDNPSNQIAKGDLVNFEGTITATSYNWTLTGPYNSNKFYNVANNATVSGTQTLGTSSNSMRVITYNHEIDVTISTVDILRWAEGTTGTYEFEVWNEAYPDTNASIEFSVNNVSVSPVLDKSIVHKGDYLTVSGTTNIAETNSIYDDVGVGLNRVFIAVYNNTTAKSGYFVDGFTDNVAEDGTFSKNIVFELGWDMDITYEIKVIALSGYNDSKSFTDEKEWAANYEDWADFYDNNSVYVDVKDPEVQFQMDDTTFNRGESNISFKGTASLAAGESVYIPVSDIDDFVEMTYTVVTMPDGSGIGVKSFIGADGSWESKDLDIKDDASIGNYTVSAKIFSSSGKILAEDTVNVSIVKQSLEANINKKTVVKGGELTINGSTSVNSVFIFASETGLFQQTVTEVPIASNYYIQSSDMEVPVDGDAFSKGLDVRISADTGNYMLYVYAPSNLTVLNTTADPNSTFSITIEDPAFINPPDGINMVQGQDKDLSLKVPEESENDVYVNFTFNGPGIKIDPSEDRNFVKTPDDEGLIELTLCPFWYDGPFTERLEWYYNLTSCEADGDSTYSVLLPAGTYSLDAELFYQNGGKINEISIPVYIVEPELSVEVPKEVSFGDELEVTVKSTREENYYGIYVILDSGLTPIAQRVNTNENGTAVASFETFWLGKGTYDIYVRDTMRTIGCGYNINDFYDLDPTTQMSDWASDDILKVRNTTVAEAASKTKLRTENITASVNTTTQVNITASNINDLANFDINVTYNSSAVNVTNVSVNPAFGTAIYNLENASEGRIRIATLNTGSGQSDNFSLLTLTLETIEKSGVKTNFNLTVNTLLDSYEMEMGCNVENGTLAIEKPGDINGDSELALTDAIYLAKHAIKLPGYKELHARGDFDCDGQEDLKDSVILAKHVVGLPGYGELHPCE